MELAVTDIVKAVLGKCLNNPLVKEPVIEEVVTDSRKLMRKGLYVPIKGDSATN